MNRPVTNFMRHNTAETIFDRLEQHGRTWKVYVLEPDPISFTGFIHMARLRDRFATHFVPFAEFERDAAEGTLPDFSLIEPNLMAGHGDYHPAFGRALIAGRRRGDRPPSSILAGEAFLGRIYDAVRSAGVSDGIERLQHHALRRLRRARGDLRPRAARAGAAPGSGAPTRAARLRLRPLGLPGAGRDRLALGRGRHACSPRSTATPR